MCTMSNENLIVSQMAGNQQDGEYQTGISIRILMTAGLKMLHFLGLSLKYVHYPKHHTDGYEI